MSRLRTISLLGISFILTTAYAISPGIPIMMEYFPEHTEASIQLLTTIPALSVMVIVLISSFISERIGSKKTVAIGLILVSIFGPLPAILDNFYLILATRVIFGIGLGLVNSLAVSLIGHFFSGNEKATKMGFRSATESVGQALLTLIAGYLLVFGGWKASFLVYLIAIPILILFLIYVPDVKSDKNIKEKNSTDSKQRINFNVIFFAFILFIVVGTYVGVKVRLSTIMLGYGYGTVSDAGNILSLLTFIGLGAGIFFGKIFGFLKSNLLPIALAVVGIGEIVVASSASLMITTVGCILIGISYPLIIAYIFTLTSSIAPKNSAVLATSIMLFGTNIGAFLAPFGLQLVGEITNSSSLTLPFYVYGIILLIFSVVTRLKLVQIDRNQLRKENRYAADNY